MCLQVKELDEEQVSQAVKCDREEQLQKKLDVCKEEANRYCLTSDCVLTTSDVLHRMDLTVNPCHDFWKYSCGGWLQAHQDEPVDRESWGIEDEVEANIRQYIRRLLESPAQCDDDYVTADCKMRLLYARCMDTETIDVVGAQPLQDILDDFGGWSALGLYCISERFTCCFTSLVIQSIVYSLATVNPQLVYRHCEILQVALLSQRGRAMLPVFLSTLQYLERSLSLLVTAASDLPMRTIKVCSVVFGVTSSLAVINNVHRCVVLVVRLPRSTNSAAKCLQPNYTVEMLTTPDGPSVVDAKAR